jgi:DNA repair photolyase
MDEAKEEYFKGRGAQIKTHNPFDKLNVVTEHIEGLDEPLLSAPTTQLFFETPKKIVNKVDSPDVGLGYSMNPYQGCEHGCIYCYARNSHQYWGFSAGLDFESKIIVKKNAAELLEKHLKNPKWQPHAIMLSGNTDCYQPIERKLRITRSMLEVLLKYKHPVSMITKNSLILRDLDILKELAKDNLVHVSISLTSLDEKLRLALEPRTASATKRLATIKTLAENNVSVGVMTAPIIPGLNSQEIPSLLKAAADHGAKYAGYTIVRLNGSIAEIFEDWIRKAFPDKAEKVLHQIAACHNGQLNDSRFGTRMRGEGKIAQSISSLFRISLKKYFKDKEMIDLNYEAFIRNPDNHQLRLF